MLGPGRKIILSARFAFFYDTMHTKCNAEYLRKCILEGPSIYAQSVYSIAAVVAKHEKDAIFLILTGLLGAEFYSKVMHATQLRRCGQPLKVQQGESLTYKMYKTILTKAKEIANTLIINLSSVFEEDNDPEQARRDKDMQKNLALLAKYFKKLYKPTNNNLRTSSNSRNKTEDTTPRYIFSATDWDYSALNSEGYGTNAKECRKPKEG
ncbi:hypothetical protein Tco_0251280 [Tanacetum coccineum]